MEESTGLAAVDAVLHSAVRHGFSMAKLKYAGGEPTLCLPLVFRLHTHAQTLARTLGVGLQATLLTNGMDVPDTALAMLRQAGIRLAVSLDGIGADHDSVRGAGTFDRVARLVDRAIAAKLPPHLSITITSRNASRLDAVAAYAMERGLSFNLNLYRRQDCQAGTDQLRAANHDLIEGLGAVLALARQQPDQPLLAGLLDRAHLGYPHKRACGVGESYVAIGHDGRLARCHMELHNPVGTVWDPDVVDLVRAPADGFQNLEVDARGECAQCTWRYWCAGGCPLLAYRATGRSDVPSPYCEVYHAILPVLLHMEGLRMIGDQSPPI